MAKIIVETTNAFVEIGTSSNGEKVTAICQEVPFEIKVIDGNLESSCLMYVPCCAFYDEIVLDTSVPIIKHNISSITYNIDAREINFKELSFRRIKDSDLLDVSAVKYNGKVYANFTKNEE